MNAEVLAKVTGLPSEGDKWFELHTPLQSETSVFRNHGEELVRKGKGHNPTSLMEPWKELAGAVQRYITCDGRYDVVRGPHLKLLMTLRQKVTLNLPYILSSLMHETVVRFRRSKDQPSMVSHRGLIKLIIVKNLKQSQLSWEEFLGILETLLREEAPNEEPGNNQLGEAKEIKSGTMEGTANTLASQQFMRVEKRMTSILVSLTRKRRRSTRMAKPEDSINLAEQLLEESKPQTHEEDPPQENEVGATQVLEGLEIFLNSMELEATTGC